MVFVCFSHRKTGFETIIISNNAQYENFHVILCTHPSSAKKRSKLEWNELEWLVSVDFRAGLL